ncbi:MAG: DNA internalization-related competence protein ComEC/Rec2 [Lachnospiraceae bacterium]
MIKRRICFFGSMFLLIIFFCRIVIGVQWKPVLHPEITTEKAGTPVTIYGKVVEKKQQSDKQILYISYKKSKTMIYNNQIQDISYGDQIVVNGTLAPFEAPRNPGNFDQVFYYYKEKISMSVFANRVWVESSNHITPKDRMYEWLFRVQKAWADLLIESMGKNKGGIMMSIILGDKSQMDGEVKELYQKNGIGHILAISGLHISFIGLGIYRLLRKTGLSFLGAGSIGMGILILYTIMVGAGVSSVRAMIMLLLRITADILGRVYDMKTALALSAVALVLWSPLYLFDAGFLLSFGALVGILYVYPLLRPKQQRKNSILDSLILSGSVNLVLFPILLYFYFEFPIYSLFLNLVVIPLMSILLGAGIIGSLVCVVCAFLGNFLLQICGLILWFYEWICKVGMELPLSRVVFGKPTLVQVAGYYLCLFLLLGIVRFIQTEHIQVKKRMGIGVGAVFLIVMCGICSFGHGKRGCLDITMLDVGQGDGIFMRGPTGQTYFIDGGSNNVKEVGKYRIEPYLKSEGVDCIDYVFLSHGHADHYNGMEELLERQSYGVRIRNLVLPKHVKMDENLLKIAKKAKEKGVHLYEMQGEDQLIEQKGSRKLSLTCLHPMATCGEEEKNESSMVLSLQMNEFRMLFTGDLEGKGETEVCEVLDGRPYDILKVPHHGSKNSGLPTFLEKVRPEIALISVGTRNHYGHPHKETLHRLKEIGCVVRETRKEGAILYRITP